MHEQWTKKYYGNHCTVQYCTVQVCFEIKHVMEDEEVAWVLEVVGCKRSHLGDMSEDEFRYIYSNEYHVVLVGDSQDPFAFFLKCVDLMCSLQASLFSLQVSATMVPMPSVKLSNCALSVEVGERFLGIGLCERVAHCIFLTAYSNE